MSVISNQQPPNGIWPRVAPYVIPPTAASLAIILVFRDLVAKSAQQKGQAIPSLTLLEGIKGGIKAAPTVGAIVGAQMMLQGGIEKALSDRNSQGDLLFTLVSSAAVGVFSAPFLAVFNGQTLGWTVSKSLREFSLRQGGAIAFQETTFVLGLSLVDPLAKRMKERFGDNKVVDYTTAFLAGATGSLVGHPANTALTRWQSGMAVDCPRQLLWGSWRKARAIGLFSVLYKWGKEALNSTASLSG